MATEVLSGIETSWVGILFTLILMPMLFWMDKKD